MNKLMVVSLAFAMSSSCGMVLAAAEDTGTHTTHSKQMKQDAGVKEGEVMKDATGASSSPGNSDKGHSMGADTHITHSKQMKQDGGVKEGEKMPDSAGAAAATGKGSSGKAMSEDSHTTHSKQMKSNTGVKEGEKMENAR